MTLAAADRPLLPSVPVVPTPYLELDVGVALDRYAALAAAGSRFDVASPAGVAACLAVGECAPDLVYSNPVKRRTDLASAAGLGVRTFVAGTSGAGSDWPLCGKFGCSPVAAAAQVFAVLRARGTTLGWLDVGGGLPAAHEGVLPPLSRYAERITALLDEHFGAQLPRLVLEPGRGIAGDAGTVVAEVLGVTWRDGPTGPAVLAGPTCDSVDVLYERTPRCGCRWGWLKATGSGCTRRAPTPRATPRSASTASPRCPRS